MQDTLLSQGLDLLVFGMGTVFVFLTLLVILTGIMSGVIGRFFFVNETEAPKPQAGNQSGQPVDKTTLAVIQAAIHAHRANRR